MPSGIDMTTIDLPVVLRDRLAAMRCHARQPDYELIEEALDLWDDARGSAAPG